MGGVTGTEVVRPRPRYTDGPRPSVRAVAAKNDAEGAGQDVQVQPHGPVANVVEIAIHSLLVGEIVAAGAPIVTIVDPYDQWLIVQVRETDMNHFRKGMTVTGNIPALGDTAVPFSVVVIAPMGDFATWRPTHQKGEFDVRTFEVRLRPDRPLADLRAGMSVNITLSK